MFNCVFLCFIHMLSIQNKNTGKKIAIAEIQRKIPKLPLLTFQEDACGIDLIVKTLGVYCCVERDMYE